MFKIKRRLSGAAGAPTSLGSGQLAWNGVDKTLYIGDGDNGSGQATSVLKVVDASATLATQTYVDGKISSLVNGAGAALDTLRELADSLGNDPNFSASVSAQISGKLSQTAVSSFMLPLLGAANQGAFRSGIGAAATTHTHAISEITNLQTTLNGKLDASGAAVLTALASVDGAGSGLDTDLVRGVTPSAFGLSILAGEAISTAADFISNVVNRILSVRAVWEAAVPVVLTDAATILVDLNAVINGKVTLAGNRVISFSGGKPGQGGEIEAYQDPTGGRTLSFTAGQCVFAGGTAITLAAAANARTLVSYKVLSDGKIFIAAAKDVK